MERMMLDPDLEEMLLLARAKCANEGDGDNTAIFCALIQVQSSRNGYCSLPGCGDCPLGTSGCVSGDRMSLASAFFADRYPLRAA